MKKMIRGSTNPPKIHFHQGKCFNLKYLHPSELLRTFLADEKPKRSALTASRLAVPETLCWRFKFAIITHLKSQPELQPMSSWAISVVTAE